MQARLGEIEARRVELGADVEAAEEVLTEARNQVYWTNEEERAAREELRRYEGQLVEADPAFAEELAEQRRREVGAMMSEEQARQYRRQPTENIGGVHVLEGPEEEQRFREAASREGAKVTIFGGGGRGSGASDG